MLNAMRNSAYREATIQERIRKGINPFSPFPPAPGLPMAPRLNSGDIADAAVIQNFLSRVLNEFLLLNRHSEEAAEQIDWMLHVFSQAARSTSLLSTYQHMTKRNALVLPSLGLAISPPEEWQIISLDGAAVRVESEDSYDHTLPETLTGRLGDPVGVVKSSGKLTIRIEFEQPQALSLCFFPIQPVCDGEIRINETSYLPMKTASGLYFWLDTESVKTMELSLALNGQTSLLRYPLLAVGEWEQPGELIIEQDNLLSPVMLGGVHSNALFWVSMDGREWRPVELNTTVALPVAETTVVETPVNGVILLPAGMIPKRIYRGHRSWYVERYKNNQLIGTSYIPYEGTSLQVGSDEMVRLRCYTTRGSDATIEAVVPGKLYVNGVEQQSKFVLPAGEAEIVIELESGTHAFYLPLPHDTHIRARYAVPRYQIQDGKIILDEPVAVPHEITLVSSGRTSTLLRVALPVNRGQPAVVADLEIK